MPPSPAMTSSSRALGGLMSITGERDGLPGGGPQKVGIAVADVLAGMYAAVAILAAVNHRASSGAGQYIDMSLLDCQVAMGGNQAVGYLTTGKPPPRYGNEHPSIVPYQTFATSDGHIIVAAGNDGQWQRYCTAIGREDLGADPRYARMKGRVTLRNVLIPELRRTMATRSTPTGCGCWRRRMCPAGRSTTTDRCLKIRRCATGSSAMRWSAPTG